MPRNSCDRLGVAKMGPLGRQKHRLVQKWLLISFSTFVPKDFASFWRLSSIKWLPSALCLDTGQRPVARHPERIFDAVSASIRALW
jgi:hypothetical protein